MSAEPLAVYADGLRAAVVGACGALTLRYADGSATDLDVHRWVGATNAGDESLLARIAGPVLDIGCGPGRFVESLGARGVRVLGIDIAADAVRLTHRRGAIALRRSVFDRVPGAGRWGTALLLDGNVGIGGDPLALLRRVRELIALGGLLFVETADPESASRRSLVRIEAAGRASSWFPWATVCVADIAALAVAASFTVEDIWTEDGRWFGELHAR